MKKVYIIQYQQGHRSNDYAETYRMAENWLVKQGYTVITQEFDEESNSAGCFETPESELFEVSRARIVSSNLIDFDILETKPCLKCGREMEKYNRKGEEFKICSKCAAELPEDSKVKEFWESIGYGNLKSDSE